MSYEIKQLRLFPFKSLKGIELDECQIDEYGFRYDRIYMLVNRGSTGYKAVTQRSDPVMALISQKLERDKLVLSYEDKSQQKQCVELPLDITAWPVDLPNIEMELWGHPFTGLDVGSSEIKEFFLDFFEQFGKHKFTPENLTVVVSKTHRSIDDNGLDVVPSFQDIYPGSLMTTESFADLEEHVGFIEEDAKINMDSFRMNILIATDEPWIEDDWKKIEISGHKWVVPTVTGRCTMPAVDQDSGQTRKNKHPLPSLNRFRVLEKGAKPCFGISLHNEDANYKIRVGDLVKVIE